MCILKPRWTHSLFSSSSFLLGFCPLFPKLSELGCQEAHLHPLRLRPPAPPGSTSCSAGSTLLLPRPQPHHLLYCLRHGEKFPGLLLPVLRKKLNVGDAEHPNKIKGVFALCLTCKTREKKIVSAKQHLIRVSRTLLKWLHLRQIHAPTHRKLWKSK